MPVNNGPNIQERRITSGSYLAAPSDSIGPVVWAVDAFPEDEIAYLKTASALQSLFSHVPIHPVYVMNEDSFSVQSASSFLRPALKPMALKALHQLMSKVHQLNLQKPRILVQNSSSRSQAARKLLRYAAHLHASMIAINCPAPTQIARWIRMGSFFETIISRSKRPVFVSGPELQMPRHRPRAIVFATDFSPECEVAFTEILGLARELPAEIHLLFKPQHRLESLIQNGVSLLGGGWVTTEPYRHTTSTNKQRHHHHLVSTWLNRAQDVGVRIQYAEIDGIDPTAKAILRYTADLNQSLSPGSTIIAMVTNANSVRAQVLGSVTRDVIRQSPSPVYIASRSSLRV